MAHTFSLLQVIQGSETRITFTNFDYTPQHPKQTVDAAAGADDGDEIASIVYKNVDESATVYLTGASADNLISQVRQIESWMFDARERQKNGTGPRIYVEFTPNGSTGGAFRSEILYGAAHLEDTVLDYEILASKGTVQIQWVRRYFWEGAEEWVPLTNSNGTNVTGGSYINIQNTHLLTGVSPNVNDATIQVASANIKGAIPAPVRLEFFNRESTSRQYTLQINGGTLTGTTYTSHYTGATLALSPGVETTLVDVSVSAAHMQQMDGAFFSILLGESLTTLSADESVWYKAEVYMNTSPIVRPLFSTGWVAEAYSQPDRNGIIDLGMVQMPPRMPDAFTVSNYMGHLVRIKAKYVGSAGSKIVTLTRVAIVPVEVNRRLTAYSFGLPPNYSLVDDGIYNRTYVTNFSTETVTNFIGRGKGIVLRPGYTNKFYFSAADAGGTYTNLLAKVRMAYRPRTVVI